jgi:hypothetical protein
MYDNEWADIDAEIKYEYNIAKYVSKPTETNNITRFLFHPDLYSTYNYQSPHNLILGALIKAHLGSLDDASLDCLNYLGLTIKFRTVNPKNQQTFLWNLRDLDFTKIS